MHLIPCTVGCPYGCCAAIGSRCTKLTSAFCRKHNTYLVTNRSFQHPACFLHQDAHVLTAIEGNLNGASTFERQSKPVSKLASHDCKQYPPIDDKLKASFADLYELGPELGRGCFAVAYEVVEKSTGTIYCAKKLPKSRLRHSLQQRIAAIEQEVTILQQLKHCRYILQFHAVVESDDSMYIITEACRGGTLEDYLRDVGALSEIQCAHAMRLILSAISACHAAGIEYGDLKPTNVLLRKKPSSTVEPLDLALADFGCSQFVDDLGRARSSPGTPLFAAPEVVYRRNGLEADLWSAGVLMYHMLSGHWPFHKPDEHLSPGAVMRRALSAPIQWSSFQWASISDGAIRLVQHMLQREKCSRITAKDALQHPWIMDQTCKCQIDC